MSKTGKECAAYAENCSREAVRKGFESSEAGVAFMAVGLELIYGIDARRAAYLTPYIQAYALEILQAQRIEDARASNELSSADLDELRARAGKNSADYPFPVFRDSANKAAERAELMGATALPPGYNK